MFTDVKTAAWILEAEGGEDESIYVCSQDIPTENEIGVVARTVLEKYGHVPMRILSPEEIKELQLEVGHNINHPDYPFRIIKKVAWYIRMNKRDCTRKIVKRDVDIIEQLVVIIEERTGCHVKITFIGGHPLIFVEEKED